MTYKNIILMLFVAFNVDRINCAQGFYLKYLIPGQIYESPRSGAEFLSIYCYRGIPKHLIHLFQTVTLHLNLSPEDYVLYRGNDSESVLEKYEAGRSWFRFNLLTWRQRVIRLEPFNSSCVGVATSNSHVVQLQIIRIDLWRIVQFGLGFALFFTASRLSSNTLFYYICGICLGVTSSFLILVYLLSKLIPKRGAVVGILVGGGTVGMYLLQLLWQNIEAITVTYHNYILSYFVISSLVSFCFCYRLGPVSNPRTHKLIQWALQGFGLLLIFLSSYYTEAILAVDILIVLYYNFPLKWTARLMSFWTRLFPPDIRRLTEDEYHQVVSRETAQELEKLRQFCSSPNCKQWKTILRLKDPRRFAEFVEGNSHLSDDELMEYEISQMNVAPNHVDYSEDESD